MTTEGEQKEAVCGTCGAVAVIVQVFRDPLTGEQPRMFLECRADPRHPHEFIPAPVVPSDDAPRREQYATSDEYRAAMVEWALSAPPTSLQDAEGDGREEAWARYDEWMRSGTYRSGMARKMRAAIESSIRADYEARLTTAKLAFARNEIHTIEEVFRMLESLGGRKDG